MECKALKMFLSVFYLNHIIGIVNIGNNIYSFMPTKLLLTTCYILYLL